MNKDLWEEIASFMENQPEFSSQWNIHPMGDDGMCPDTDASRGGLIQEPPEEDFPIVLPTHSASSSEHGMFGMFNTRANVNMSTGVPVPTTSTHVDNGPTYSGSVPLPVSELATTSSSSSVQPGSTQTGVLGISGGPVRIGMPGKTYVKSTAKQEPDALFKPQEFTNTIHTQTKDLLTNKLQGKMEPHETPVDEEPLTMATPTLNSKDDEKKARARKHAQDSRLRTKKKMEDLEKLNKELEAKQGINKKIISILWKRLHDSYPQFKPHVMKWFRTADGRDGPIPVTVLLPDTSPEFLNELGNNPGNGHLYCHKRSSDEIESESGSPNNKTLKLEDDVESGSSQEDQEEESPQGNVPTLDILEPANELATANAQMELCPKTWDMSKEGQCTDIMTVPSCSQTNQVTTPAQAYTISTSSVDDKPISSRAHNSRTETHNGDPNRYAVYNVMKTQNAIQVPNLQIRVTAHNKDGSPSFMNSMGDTKEIQIASSARAQGDFTQTRQNMAIERTVPSSETTTYYTLSNSSTQLVSTAQFADNIPRTSIATSLPSGSPNVQMININPYTTTEDQDTAIETLVSLCNHVPSEEFPNLNLSSTDFTYVINPN